MRESLALRLPKFALLWLVLPAMSRAQLNTWSARHCDSGWLPAGCCARGGTAYRSTGSVEMFRLTDGLLEFNEEVFDIVHCRMVVLVPTDEKTASELRKYSVPPLVSSNWLPGVI